MLRTLVCTAIALVLTANLGLAKEAKKADPNAVAGVIKKIDAATGTLTVTVGKKDEKTDKEFKVGEATKFVIIISKDNKKELSSKDGLKAEELKVGARVYITSDTAGKVTMVTIAPSKK